AGGREVVERGDRGPLGHLGDREAERLAAALEIGAGLREIERRQLRRARAAARGRLDDAQRPGARGVGVRRARRLGDELDQAPRESIDLARETTERERLDRRLA